MKPKTLLTLDQAATRGDQRTAPVQSTFPTVDYAFQPTTLEATVRSSGSADLAQTEARTFRNISRLFIESGSGREYLAEAFFFTWIGITAALPTAMIIRQIFSLLNGH